MKLPTLLRRAPLSVLLLALWSSGCSEETGNPLLGPLATASPQGEQQQTSDPLAGTETVLLVDDEKEVRLLARTALTRSGYTVLEVESGAEALELMADNAEPVDLLLTEVNTPDMSGRALAEELQEDQPELKVLFLADSSEVSSVPGSVRLDKPFTSEELLTRVREILGPLSGSEN